MRAVTLDGESLTLEQLESIADGAPCRLAPQARRRVRASRDVVERAIEDGGSVYGINTGFGELARIRIGDEHLDELQSNLVRSHSAGVGEPLPERTVRAILALRLNCLARGHSGIRVETLATLLKMLNSGIHPVVPSQGSVGASGDLAPLAHVALAAMGEGDVFKDGRRISARRAMRAAGIPPVQLRAKEGLALINGTQMMTAVGGLAVLRAERLAVLADIAGAMSLEALKGSHRAFDRRIQSASGRAGQAISAANLRKLLRGSAVERSHVDCGRVQDAYSLRCMPQVHGAVRDATGLRAGRTLTVTEVNASTDNPDGLRGVRVDVISAGNFHGQPVSRWRWITWATAACSLGARSANGASERLLEPETLSVVAGLPGGHDPGLDFGFHDRSGDARRLLFRRTRSCAHPASVDSIPTSAGKEDHVSMGAHARSHRPSYGY